jgi:uncharacterized protein (TIGR03435 family)
MRSFCGRIQMKLSLRLKHLVLSTATVAVALGALGVRPSVTQEVRTETKPVRFDTVSIRPVSEDASGVLSLPKGVGFRVRAMPLAVLVQMAFGTNPNQMVLPPWTQEAKFDIVATTGGDAPLRPEEMKPLLEAMLAERFGMTYHRETREVRGYELVAAKGGLKLTPAKAGAARAGTASATSIAMPSATMDAFAAMLAARLEVPVRDKTGAKGDYQVELHFARADDPESTSPSISTALNEGMGLRLVSAKVPVQVVVITHIERSPTEN